MIRECHKKVKIFGNDKDTISLDFKLFQKEIEKIDSEYQNCVDKLERMTHYATIFPIRMQIVFWETSECFSDIWAEK